MSEDFPAVRTRLEHAAAHLGAPFRSLSRDIELALAELDRLSRCLDEAGYLTPYEVADRLRVSKMTVYRLLESGQLAAIRVGRSYRIPAAAFEAFIATTAVAGGDA